MWCTTRPTWEPTANKALRQKGRTILTSLTKQETAAECEGLYRIEVLPDAAPYGWDEFRRLSGIDTGVAKRLARASRVSRSDYHDYRVSFEPVTADRWVRIEIEHGADRWIEVSRPVLTSWTRPIQEKGCVVCSDMDTQRESIWRYAPHPKTGEPRVMCSSCYAMIEKRAHEGTNRTSLTDC
ncbi:MAG: hypothetical protein ABIU05_01760 [Nitrospirales bacterium]